MTLFTPKFEESKKLRSVRLTDTAWDALDRIASEHGVTRTDLLEEWSRRELWSPKPSHPTLTREDLEEHMNKVLEHVPIKQKGILQRKLVAKYFQELLEQIFP